MDGVLRRAENQVRLTWFICSATSTLGCLLLLKLERFRGRDNHRRIGNAIVRVFFRARILLSMLSTLFTILLLHSSLYIGISTRLTRFYVTGAGVNWRRAVLDRSGGRHILWLHKFRKRLTGHLLPYFCRFA